MILGSQAKLENDNRGINVRCGLKNKVEMGWRPGMPPLGYSNEKSINRRQNRIFVDEDRTPAIRRVFREIATGRWILNWSCLWPKYEAVFFTKNNGSLSERKLKAILRDPFCCERPKRAVPVRYRPLVGIRISATSSYGAP